MPFLRPNVWLIRLSSGFTDDEAIMMSLRETIELQKRKDDKTPKDISGLTVDQMIIEAKRVVKSFPYFIDNYVFLEDKSAGIAVRFRLWPDQLKILPKITDSKLLMILKARQLGLTWLVAAYVLWLSLTNPLHLSIIISVTEELAIEFLDRVYFILDRLPFYLRHPIKSRTKQLLEFQYPNQLVSTIKSLATTITGGASKTPNVLILDETCRNPLVKHIYNATLPGIEAAKGKCILISNSIKEGPGWDFTRTIYTDSMHGANKFERIFLPWQSNPTRPENFKELMKDSGMADREIMENYPDTEEDAISDRNIRGIYYSQQMKLAREQGRICEVPYNQSFKVYTAWDIGIADSTCIIFFQQIGLSIRFIDAYSNFGQGLAHYAKIIKEKPYLYAEHYVPHDMDHRDWGGETDVALSRKEVAENMGIEPIIIVKRARDTQAVLNGIEAVRNMLGQCYFDRVRCKNLVEALETYRSEWDEEKQVLSAKPLHDWSSDYCDSMRTCAVGFVPVVNIDTGRQYRNSFSDVKHSYLGG